jgi:tRNA (guanine26-N2/guanine27-N2)-dimethyltransferase
MALDRDLSVAAASALAATTRRRSATGWEMLAATGVRGLRLLGEAELLGALTLTEAQPSAVEVLRANAAPFASLGARVLAHDARRPLPDGPFDFVDLDPYGSPAPYLPALLGAVRPGGIAGVTATDLRVLAGADPRSCERRYAARPLPGRLGPEAGLRILLGWIAHAAGERGLSVHPLLAYVGGHYLRAWLRVERGGGIPPGSVAMLDPTPFVGSRAHPKGSVGPMWTGPLFDRPFVERLSVPASAARPLPLRRLLDVFREESSVDAPLFFEANELARDLGLGSPPSLTRILATLREAGWRSSRTHVRPAAFRTEAPRAVIEEAARAAARAPATSAGASP